MTQEELTSYIKEMPLAAYNNEKVELNDDTVLSTVVSHDDNSLPLFRGTMKWFFKANGIPTPNRWPGGWENLSVRDFAKIFIPVLLLCFSLVSQAQLTIDLGTVKTTNKATAISIGISYFRSLDSIWKLKDIDFVGKHSIFSINPEFNVRFGSADAFNSIQAKVVGSFISFKTIDWKGYKAPDYSKTMGYFPIALGVEANSAFTIYNGIFEAGYQPFYQSETNNVGSVLRHTNLGLWIQAGYKFKGDSTATPLTGGAKDESSEKYNSTIVRAKGHFGIDTKDFLKAVNFSMGLVGNADVWYDMINSRFYHKIDAIGRIYLQNGAWIDLVYSKGAGAPTFNSNEQYGVGFKVQL